MKRLITITCLIMLLSLGMVSADTMDLNVSTAQDLDADIDLYSGENMSVDVNVNSEGNITLNENYNNYQYYEKLEQITKKTTNAGGILRTMANVFKIYFGDYNPRSVDRDEAETLTYLNKFRESILQEVYQTQVKPLQLELMAQRKINEKLTIELAAIHERNGWEIDKHGLECYGYIRVMMEEEVGVDSVTCREGNETQTWHNLVGDTAVMLTPIFNEEEFVEQNISEDNVTNEKTVELGVPSKQIIRSRVCYGDNCTYVYQDEDLNASLSLNTTGNQTANVTIKDETFKNETSVNETIILED